MSVFSVILVCVLRVLNACDEGDLSGWPLPPVLFIHEQCRTYWHDQVSGCASCLTAIDWFSHEWDKRRGCKNSLADRRGTITHRMFSEVTLTFLNWMWCVTNKNGITHVYHALAQLVPGLRYKPEGRGFDSRWCHCNL